jgi:hypothetical protein
MTSLTAPVGGGRRPLSSACVVTTQARAATGKSEAPQPSSEKAVRATTSRRRQRQLSGPFSVPREKEFQASVLFPHRPPLPRFFLPPLHRRASRKNNVEKPTEAYIPVDTTNLSFPLPPQHNTKPKHILAFRSPLMRHQLAGASSRANFLKLTAGIALANPSPVVAFARRRRRRRDAVRCGRPAALRFTLNPFLSVAANSTT